MIATSPSTMEAQAATVCRFLDLPAEVRLKVYSFVFDESFVAINGELEQEGDFWEIYPTWQLSLNIFDDGRELLEKVDATKFPRALTQTNSFIRREAQPAVASATELWIYDIQVQLAISHMPGYLQRHLRHLTLSRRVVQRSDRKLPNGIFDISALPSLQSLTVSRHYPEDLGEEESFRLDSLLKEEFRSLEHYKEGFKESDFRMDELLKMVNEVDECVAASVKIMESVSIPVILHVHYRGDWVLEDSDGRSHTMMSCLHIYFDMRIRRVFYHSHGRGSYMED